jgi:Rod binding domain-containing protein
MTTASALASQAATAYGNAAGAATGGKKLNARAWSTAQDFESMFVHTMFESMSTDVDGEGPFGGGPATGIWRSFLTQEYAKSFVKHGGIGLASRVYDSLLAHQEANATAASALRSAPTRSVPITVPRP